MKVEKKNLEKSQIELTVELSVDEFKPYIQKGADRVSQEVKIDGFRPGKVPFDVLKQKVGEMSILEEAARIAISKTIDDAIKNNVEDDVVGQPKVDITKLAPNNALEFKVTLATVPEIKMCDYKDQKVKQASAKAEDKEVEKTLNDIRDMKTQEAIVDREVKDGDKVVVDIEMFLDKVPLEGGQNKDAAIIIGKDFIVPGFDKKLVGAKKDDVREFSLPYPKDFHMKNLAGKMVEFKVKVKDVYERKLPELNDTLAEGFGMKKLEELKDNIKKSIESQKQKEVAQVAEREMLDKLIEKSRFGDIAQSLVDHELDIMMSEMEQSIAQQGGKMEDYLNSLGKTQEQMAIELMPEAMKRVKASLLIREIAKKEKIKVEEKELDEHIQEMKKHYKDNQEAMKRVDTPEYRNYVANVFTSRKVVDKLREWNITKE